MSRLLHGELCFDSDPLRGIRKLERQRALHVVRIEVRHLIVVGGASGLGRARERFGTIGEEQPHLMIRARRHFQLRSKLVERAAREPDEIERDRRRQREFQPRRIVRRSGGAFVDPQFLHRDAHVRITRANVGRSGNVHAGVACSE